MTPDSTLRLHLLLYPGSPEHARRPRLRAALDALSLPTPAKQRSRQDPLLWRFV